MTRRRISMLARGTWRLFRASAIFAALIFASLMLAGIAVALIDAAPGVSLSPDAERYATAASGATLLMTIVLLVGRRNRKRAESAA